MLRYTGAEAEFRLSSAETAQVMDFRESFYCLPSTKFLKTQKKHFTPQIAMHGSQIYFPFLTN